MENSMVHERYNNIKNFESEQYNDKTFILKRTVQQQGTARIVVLKNFCCCPVRSRKCSIWSKRPHRRLSSWGMGREQK